MLGNRIVVGFVLTTLGCTSALATTLITKRYKVAAINSIVVNGDFNLNLKPSTKAQALVKTNSFAEAPITLQADHGTLYLSSAAKPANQKKSASVEISLKNLAELTVHGAVNISAKQMPKGNLILKTDGYGKIRLKQAGAIKLIKQTDNSRINITGIQSPYLTVNALAFGTMHLQGKVNQLFVRLSRQAVLHAEKLPANYLTIQAKGNSEAYVYPLKTLRAFTQQSGEIFYRHQSPDLTRYSVDSGNVLQIQ